MAISENRKAEFDELTRQSFFEDTQLASEVLRQRIRHFRQERDLTEEQLGQAMTEVGIRLSGDRISKIETGRRKVRIDELLAFAYVLKVPLSRLMSSPDGDRPVRAGGIGLERHEVGNWMVWGDTKQAARAKWIMRLTYEIQMMYRIVEADPERVKENRRVLARLVREMAELVAIPPRVIRRQAEALAKSKDDNSTASA